MPAHRKISATPAPRARRFRLTVDFKLPAGAKLRDCAKMEELWSLARANRRLGHPRLMCAVDKHEQPTEVPECHPLAARLSGRRRATLELLRHGKSRKEIAQVLGLSPNTVNDYVKAVYKHFGVAGQTELMSRLAIHPR